MSSKEQIQSYLKLIKESGDLSGIPESELPREDRELLEQLWSEGLVDKSRDMLEGLDIDEDWSKLQAHFQDSKVRRLTMPRIMKYAAIFVGVVCLSLFFKYMIDSPKSIGLPNGNVITLNTGKDIKAILANKKQTISLSSGEVVAVQEDNLLRYIGESTSEDLVYNELQIPYGKTFTLLLSDGTRVELNSGTKIKFPARFPKVGKREVFMEGEAYFKVSKDKEHPFIVNSDDVAVEVLGTEFNVSAYAEQSDISTVLVEGSVSLSHSANPGDTLLLKPGNKGTWSKSKAEMEISQVNTSLYTSWLTGEIVFRDTPFSDLLLKLERTYNVSIINHNKDLAELTFNARYNRNVETIADVLEALKVIVPFEYNTKEGSAGTHQLIVIN